MKPAMRVRNDGRCARDSYRKHHDARQRWSGHRTGLERLRRHSTGSRRSLAASEGLWLGSVTIARGGRAV